MNRIARFARSPQGRQLTRKATELAKDPKTRAKIDQYRRKSARPR